MQCYRFAASVLAASIILVPLLASASHGDHVVISEVQVGGAGAKDEFVELYNPTAAAISLEGWRLSKRTASGSESNLLTTFPVMTIAPHASLLFCPSDSAFAAQADALFSTTQTLAANNSAVLYGPVGGDGSRSVVDLVGWGTAASFEGSAAAADPPTSMSIERKPGGGEGNGTDTGDNAADFALLASPIPQNGSAVARPTIAAPPPAPPQDEGEIQTTTPIETATDSATAPLETATSSATTSSSTPDTTPSPSVTSSPLTEPSRSPPPPQPTHVRINEFVSDPTDGDVEWVELVNTGPNAVNLADWVLEDGGERRTILTGALPIGGFFVVSAPKGSLNNDGDRIVLRQPDGTRVDAVSYGDWNDGKVSDNAPVAGDPTSVARVTDGGDTDNDRADWVRTETPTKGVANIIASVPDRVASETTAVSSDATRAGERAGARGRAIIVLNELLPDPAGDDLTDEYIEIANLGDVSADLAGWRLEDELGTEYSIARAGGDGAPPLRGQSHTDAETAIGPGGFVVLPRSRTGIALNNTGGETVRLFKPDGDRAASVASWSGAAAEGSAWTRGSDGRWRWSTTPTRGEQNTITTPNRPPDAVIAGPDTAAPDATIAFDASDSADPDSEALTYLWNFGDPATEADVATTVVGRYVYATDGTYTVTLTVTDARGAQAMAKQRVVVGMDVGTPSSRASDSESRDLVTGREISPLRSQTSSGRNDGVGIRLSELLPNPSGSDDAEWVEIENVSDADASLDGWTLATVSGTERVTELPPDIVPARGFLVLPRSVVRFALRNDGGAIELRDPDGAVADSVAYEKARDGWAFARGPSGWQWTSAPTSGAANALVLGVRVGGRSLPTPSYSPSRREGENQPLPAAIAELDDLPRGEIVRIRGTVTAAPGTVGKQIFYVADATAGVQVYVGKRAIPPLAAGTTITVTGELRDANGEQRIGIRSPEDIMRELPATSPDAAVGIPTSDRRDSQLQAITTPEPQAFRVADASDTEIGDLITFDGEVMEVRGRIIHVDDGSDEIRVALPANAVDAAESYRAGDAVHVVGILGKTQSGYRVLARATNDLAITRRARIAPASEILPLQPLRRSIEMGLLGAVAGALILPSLWRRRGVSVRILTLIKRTMG